MFKHFSDTFEKIEFFVFFLIFRVAGPITPRPRVILLYFLSEIGDLMIPCLTFSKPQKIGKIFLNFRDCETMRDRFRFFFCIDLWFF